MAYGKSREIADLTPPSPYPLTPPWGEREILDISIGYKLVDNGGEGTE